MVISTEVIEDLFCPRTPFALARWGGLIVTTPYHGYLKKLFLSSLIKWDWHHHVDHKGRHIKKFSPKTLRTMMQAEGFKKEGWQGCGRVPALWKSMVIWEKKKA